jgi:hypothetical protein
MNQFANKAALSGATRQGQRIANGSRLDDSGHTSSGDKPILFICPDDRVYLRNPMGLMTEMALGRALVVGDYVEHDGSVYVVVMQMGDQGAIAEEVCHAHPY